MGTTRILAAVAVATLIFSACSADASTATDDELAALQTQVDDLTKEIAELKEQADTAADSDATPDEEPTPPAADAPEPEAEPAQPEETAPPAAGAPEPEAEAAQVESMLAFNSVDPASFPDAAPGEVSIVSILDPAGRDSGLVVIRNGTDQTLTGFEVSVQGRDAAGVLVATGSDQGSVEPTLIGPGQLAIASIYMGIEELPADTEFEYEIVAIDTDTAFIGKVSVPIIETSLIGPDVLGVAKNSTDAEVSGPISVLYICIGLDNEITGYASAYADQDALDPGATTNFKARIYRGATCEQSIAGASGWDF